MQAKQNVKFYKTPDAVLQRQLTAYDEAAAKKAGENPLFKEIVESQKAFAAARRAVGTWTPTSTAAWRTTTTSARRPARRRARPRRPELTRRQEHHPATPDGVFVLAVG